MKFKLVEAAESKICCICKKPFDGYGNNAEPVCSGSCCDECNMKEVIPARMKMLDNSSSEDIDETVLIETNESGEDEIDANCEKCGAIIKVPADFFDEIDDEGNLVDKKVICASCREKNESLNEGNPVSGKIPPALDSFLQDIAQIFGTIDYGDIMEHDYSADDIRKLNNLRRRFITWAQYDEDDEEVKAKFDEIANKVAEILKSDKLEEAIDPSKALEVKKNSDADVIFYGWQYKNEKPVEFDPPKELSSDEYKAEVQTIVDSKTKLNADKPTGNRYGYDRDFTFYALYNRKNESDEKDDNKMNEANLGRKFSELEKANNNLINKIRKEFRKFTDHHYYDVDAGEYNWHVWNKDDFKHMQQFLRDLNIPLHSDNADDYEVYDEWRDDEGWGDFAIWNSYRLIHRLYPNIKYERTSNWAKQYGYNENPQWIVDGDDNKMNEDMSIRAKLKALYPELNFGDEVVDESLNEEVDSEIAIPTPYDKYFEIIEVEYDEDDDYSYKPGDKIDDVTILADVAAKDEWADQFDSIYSLTDDSQFPIVEIVHDRLYPVELPEDDLNEATDNQVAGQMSFFDDDMDFDIEEDDEIRRMNTLYKGADFDAYDDEALEESSDCEDDECWENDLISDDYDDGM